MGGEPLAHTHTSANTLKTDTRAHTHTHTTVHSQCLQVHESRKAGVSYRLDSVVMKMPMKAKAVLHTHL